MQERHTFFTPLLCYHPLKQLAYEKQIENSSQRNDTTEQCCCLQMKSFIVVFSLLHAPRIHILYSLPLAQFEWCCFTFWYIDSVREKCEILYIHVNLDNPLNFLRYPFRIIQNVSVSWNAHHFHVFRLHIACHIRISYKFHINDIDLHLLYPLHFHSVQCFIHFVHAYSGESTIVRLRLHT